MEAQVWTLIAVLSAALLGLGGAFFAMYMRLDARIDSQTVRIDALSVRMDELGTKIDELGASLRAAIDGLSARLAEHVERHSSA